MANTKPIPTMHLSEKLHELMQETERVMEIQDRLCGLQDSIALDLIDGWSTGDKLLDFVLLACNGVYSTDIIDGQYREFENLLRLSSGKLLLVVQEADYYFDNDFCNLRNIYLAEVRSDDSLEFNMNEQIMKIPVNSGYMLWREALDPEREVRSFDSFILSPWIEVGPLVNDLCRFGHGMSGEKGVVCAPHIGSCAVYFHPWNPEELEIEHDIDTDLTRILMRKWMSGRARIISGRR